MIGVIVVGHGGFPMKLLNTASLFCDKSDKAIAVSFASSQSCDELYDNLEAAVRKLDCAQGVLILTDIDGGTPSNQALRLAMRLGHIEVVSGVNLPVLITALFERDSLSLLDLRKHVIEVGVVSIVSLNEKAAAWQQAQVQCIDNQEL